MSEEEEVPQSQHNKIPWWLYVTYITLIVWGVWAFFAYWNGAKGVRGYWTPLQKAAETTFPFEKKEPFLDETLLH
ncbi:MAG: hypothetical protein H7A36_00045 [Chlamydiales bacterium]|nr:hypothetical protein [Chlamydiales bacterium]